MRRHTLMYRFLVVYTAAAVSQAIVFPSGPRRMLGITQSPLAGPEVAALWRGGKVVRPISFRTIAFLFTPQVQIGHLHVTKYIRSDCTSHKRASTFVKSGRPWRCETSHGDDKFATSKCDNGRAIRNLSLKSNVSFLRQFVCGMLLQHDDAKYRANDNMKQALLKEGDRVAYTFRGDSVPSTAQVSRVRETHDTSDAGDTTTSIYYDVTEIDTTVPNAGRVKLASSLVARAYWFVLLRLFCSCTSLL